MPIVWDLDLRHPWMEIAPAKLHGLVCSKFEGAGADHHSGQKPFTAWPLSRGPDQEAGISRLRMTWLKDAIDGDVAARVASDIQFGSARCAIIRHSQLSRTYAALAAAGPANRARFTFHAPTVFSRNGKRHPVLDPDLVLGGLAHRWNSHSPVQLPANALAELRETIRVDGWSAETTPVDLGKLGTVVGFTGQLDVSIPGTAGKSCRHVFGALIQSAGYLGVGAMCTYGLGVISGTRIS